MSRKKSRKGGAKAPPNPSDQVATEFRKAVAQHMATAKKYGHEVPVSPVDKVGGRWVRTGPPEGVNKRDVLGLLVVLATFLPYLLFAAPRQPWLLWLLLGWSGASVTLAVAFIQGFKRELQYTPFSYDTVPAQLVLGAALAAHFGIANFCLAMLDLARFGGSGITSLFDGIFYGVATVATLGYSDILPLDPVSRTLWMFGVLFGIWFLVTVFPVALEDQMERLRDLRTSQARLDAAAQKARAMGILTPVNPPDPPA